MPDDVILKDDLKSALSISLVMKTPIHIFKDAHSFLMVGEEFSSDPIRVKREDHAWRDLDADWPNESLYAIVGRYVGITEKEVRQKVSEEIGDDSVLI